MAYPSPFGPQLGSNQFGAGSLSAGTSGLISASGGLGNTRGTPSGRSSFDLGRMSEQAIRDMRRKGNFAGAFGIGANMATIGMRMSEAQQEQAGMNALQNAFQQMGGQGQPAQAQPMAFGATNQAGWGNVGGDTGTREGNIEAAKKSGNFEAIVNRYNQMAQGSGKMMDAQGNIVPVGANATTTTKNPAYTGSPEEDYNVPPAN